MAIRQTSAVSLDVLDEPAGVALEVLPPALGHRVVRRDERGVGREDAVTGGVGRICGCSGPP